MKSWAGIAAKLFLEIIAGGPVTISYGINVFIGMVLEFWHVGLTDRFHLRRLGSYHIGLLLLSNLPPQPVARTMHQLYLL